MPAFDFVALPGTKIEKIVDVLGPAPESEYRSSA
jgi:hypothetical protein